MRQPAIFKVAYRGAMKSESLSPESSREVELAKIGLSLRKIRRQKGLTLQEVERRSKGEWKAVVVGSYERNDRALTIRRALQLSAFYDVPLSELLGIATSTEVNKAERLILDMRRLGRLAQSLPGLEPVNHFALLICARRRDWNGEVLSLREEDLSTLALINFKTENEMHQELEANGLILHSK